MKYLLAALLCLSLSVHAAERSYKAKAEFVRTHPCPGTGSNKLQYGCRGWIIDHVIPLACGGADAAFNMQWQTMKDAKAKDKWERKGC